MKPEKKITYTDILCSAACIRDRMIENLRNRKMFHVSKMFHLLSLFFFLHNASARAGVLCYVIICSFNLIVSVMLQEHALFEEGVTLCVH